MNVRIENILNDLEEKGYFYSDKIIDNKDLKNLQNIVNHKLKEYGQKNFWLNDDILRSTYANDDEFNNKIKRILINICEKYNLHDHDKHDLYKVVRVITGKNQKIESHKYHFDAHFLTVLIPIYIPNKENSGNGDLVIFSNLRKITNNLYINIFQKLLFQNFISRKLLSNDFGKKLFKYKKLKLIPGCLYIICGFRTLHGNIEIGENDLRATLLIHFYDIFKNSKLIEFNRKLKINKENKNIMKI